MPITQKPVVLLGAGASVEAGVPATFEMTEKLVERIGASGPQRTGQALNFVCGALIGHDSAEGASPYAGLDVERVFAAIELLAERRTLEVTPFVASWAPAVDAWDRPAPPSSPGRRLSEALVSPFPGKVDSVLTDLIQGATGEGTGRTYRRLADEMINELRALVATRPKDVSYLAPLAAAAQEEDGLTVATLNYDLAVEQVGDHRGVSVHTGIDSWTMERHWRWPSHGIRLLKLHGSIDWCWHSEEGADGRLPTREVCRTDDPQNERREPALVFGQRGKLRAEGPFLSLLSEFETLLAETAELLVIGYSFRDEHVNEAIRQWTSEDLTRRLVVVDPGFPERPGRLDFRASLLEYLNPPPYKPDAWPSRVQILRLPASTALTTAFQREDVRASS